MPFKMKYKNLKEIVGELQNASKMHKKQAKKIDEHINEMESGDSPTKKRGLWDNIHAKRKRIKKGSGETMRKPGSKGAPSKQDLIDSALKAHDLSKEATDAEIAEVIKEIREIEKKLGTYKGPNSPKGEKLSENEREDLQDRRRYLYHLRETTHAD